jgi:hypothetical protein
MDSKVKVFAAGGRRFVGRLPAGAGGDGGGARAVSAEKAQNP